MEKNIKADIYLGSQYVVFLAVFQTLCLDTLDEMESLGTEFRNSAVVRFVAGVCETCSYVHVLVGYGILHGFGAKCEHATWEMRRSYRGIRVVLVSSYEVACYTPLGFPIGLCWNVQQTQRPAVCSLHWV